MLADTRRLLCIMLADTTVAHVTHACTIDGAFAARTIFVSLSKMSKQLLWWSMLWFEDFTGLWLLIECGVTQCQFCWRDLFCPENWFLSCQQIDQVVLLDAQHPPSGPYSYWPWRWPLWSEWIETAWLFHVLFVQSGVWGYLQCALQLVFTHISNWCAGVLVTTYLLISKLVVATEAKLIYESRCIQLDR